MSDQLPLFNQRTMRARTKVPISAERIKEVQAMINKGDYKTAAEKLREVRYGLENYCKRINNA